MCVGQDITDQDTGSPTKLFHQPFAQPMAHPRKQLLREWLQEQLEMGRFPGVYYVNVAGTPPKSHFRIPWLHKAKPNWNEEYLALFRVSICNMFLYNDKNSFNWTLIWCISSNNPMRVYNGLCNTT